MINSRQKGARGERLWRDELRAQGFNARRGQQFSGSPDSPDVVCEALTWAHFEVKAVERLNIEDAMEQARRDAGAKLALVAHKRNHRAWLVTMDAGSFFRIVRGDLQENTQGTGVPRSGRRRRTKQHLAPTTQDEEGHGDPRSGRCRGGTGHGGGGGAGQGTVASEKRRDGATGEPRRRHWRTTADEGAPGRGETDENYGSETSAADGGPRMSHWPATGEVGADSGEATAPTQSAESIRLHTKKRMRTACPATGLEETDLVTAHREEAGPGDRPAAQTQPLEASLRSEVRSQGDSSQPDFSAATCGDEQ